MINQNPIVSAVVSTYNAEFFFQKKLEDLLQQTIANNLEIIIINSGSQEAEDRIVKKYLDKYPNIKYVRTEERESIYKAWNRGIKIASGKYITNANTDDRLKKDAFQILSTYLENNPKIAVVYADQYISNIPNQTFEEVISSKHNKLHISPDFDYLHLLDRCLIFSQPMWRKSLHSEDNIWFDEKYEISGDYDFYFKVAQSHSFNHINIPLGVFYLSPNKENKSHKQMEKVIAERDNVSAPYIVKYIDESVKSVLLSDFNKLRRHTFLPIPIYYILKRIILFVNPTLVRTVYFHSIEFIYYFCIIYLNKNEQHKKAYKLLNRISRFSSSTRIKDLKKNFEK